MLGFTPVRRRKNPQLNLKFKARDPAAEERRLNGVYLAVGAILLLAWFVMLKSGVTEKWAYVVALGFAILYGAVGRTLSIDRDEPGGSDDWKVDDVGHMYDDPDTITPAERVRMAHEEGAD